MILELAVTALSDMENKIQQLIQSALELAIERECDCHKTDYIAVNPVKATIVWNLIERQRYHMN